MKVALFVEGAENRVVRRGVLLTKIWEQVAGALGLVPFSAVVPITKKHLLAMDPEQPPMSGAGEGLDLLMARCLESDPFDAAVVAWDLVPPRDAEVGYCRWRETLDLYRCLAGSPSLPVSWRQAAGFRHRKLMSRRVPGDRRGAHRVDPYQVIAVCMEPMFESLLLQKEQHVLRALGIGRPPDWPRRGWGSTTRRPDHEILIPMVESFKALPRSRRPRVAKTLGVNAKDKDPWLEYLLRRLLADPEARALVLDHPICRRLAECLAPH